MENEIWKDVKNYEGLYEVSNLGRVKCLPRTVAFGKQKRYVEEHLMTIHKDKMGIKTPHVYFKKHGKTETFLVPNLVFETFVEQINPNLSVYPLDGNPNNCTLTNIGLTVGYQLWNKKLTKDKIAISRQDVFEEFYKLTDDEILKLIQNGNYTSVSDVRNKNKKLFQYINRYKRYIFDEFYGSERHSLKKRCIYSYHFIVEDEDYIYVGLTYNHIHRDYQHRTQETSAVYQFANKHCLEIPEMKIEVDYTDADIAARLEGETLQYYIDKGYISLNKAKTGGLGGNQIKNYTTYEQAKKEVVNFKNICELYHQNHTLYLIITRNGWDELLPPKTRKDANYWNEQTINDVISKCQTKKEFYSNYPAAYRAIYKRHRNCFKNYELLQ